MTAGKTGQGRGKTEIPLRGENGYLRRQGYNQRQRGEELGRDERTIRRWDAEDREKLTDPATPLQQEAWEMCSQGNHEWMTSVAGMQRYRDQAFSAQVIREATDAEGMVTARHIKTCYFCKHKEEWTRLTSVVMFE